MYDFLFTFSGNQLTMAPSHFVFKIRVITTLCFFGPKNFLATCDGHADRGFPVSVVQLRELKIAPLFEL